MQDRARRRGRGRPRSRESGGTITLRGMLIPTDWDDEYEVHKVALLTDDEDEFVVDGNHYSERLMKHLEDNVIVWGTVRTDEHGNKFIRVSGFEVVAWDEDS